MMGMRKISAQYSVIEAGTFADRVAARMRRKMFARFLDTGVDASDLLLDVGVTSDDELEASNYLEAWYPHKHMVTACGIDDASFLEARYPGMVYVQADGRNLPFADESFDVVHSSAVLEHVGSREKQEKFISELVRVARRSIFITTPNRWYPIELHSALPLLHWLPPTSYRKALRRLGHDMLSKEENLNLLGRRDLKELCDALSLSNYTIDSVRLLGLPSNLLLTIHKQ